MFTNPILKSYKNLYIYLLIWLINTVIYFIVLNTVLDVNTISSLTEALVFNILLSAFSLSFWYAAKYISFENNGIVKILLNHFIGGVLASITWLSLGYFIMESLPGTTPEFSVLFYNTLILRFLIGFLFYFLITSFYYIIIYYSGFQERLSKEAELKNLVTEAELKSLKFQINPHFIFNSLNSMSALTTIDPDKAKSMILKLADFLRYTLANNDRQLNKLSEELKNLKLYLEIEKIRFEDKFDYCEDIQAECLEVSLPNMILQPLFENAIKHAVYETLDKVTLILKCKSENDFMKISLENNFDSETSSRKGAGVGLKNIKERLKLFYGQDNLLEIKKEKNNFKVTLFIPLNNEIIIHSN